MTMKCTFCGEDVKKGTGLLFVKADGTVHSFCSSKCKHNHVKLRRSGIKTKWTKSYKEFREINKGKKIEKK